MQENRNKLRSSQTISNSNEKNSLPTEGFIDKKINIGHCDIILKNTLSNNIEFSEIKNYSRQRSQTFREKIEISEIMKIKRKKSNDKNETEKIKLKGLDDISKDNLNFVEDNLGTPKRGYKRPYKSHKSKYFPLYRN